MWSKLLNNLQGTQQIYVQNDIIYSIFYNQAMETTGCLIADISHALAFSNIPAMNRLSKISIQARQIVKSRLSIPLLCKNNTIKPAFIDEG